MSDKRLKPAPRPPCDHLAVADASVVASVKALHTGTASPHQQRLALDWILREACARAYFPYHPNPHDTAFALGRAFAADAIVGLINAEAPTQRRVDHVPETTAPRSPQA